MNQPALIVSLNYEGKFGITDHLTNLYAFLNNDNLKKVI